MSGPVPVPTAYGEGRLTVHRARKRLGTLLLSHGAGGGTDARDLQALATVLPRHGFSVALFDQPWRVAGRRLATPPPTLDAGLVAAYQRLGATGPVVLGGRSAGARSAARCSAQLETAGVLALSFPLHPPGRPERSRVAEIEAVSVPLLVVQGERDTMGRPDAFPGNVDLAVVPAADHGMRVPARAPLGQDEAMEVVVEAVLEWLTREVVGSGSGE